MGKPTGFLEFSRAVNPSIEPAERIRSFEEFHPYLSEKERICQAGRCMDCGVPFCQSGALFGGMYSGCPLHNLIPEWNDEIWHGNWREALSRLLKTNNFPEFTGRVCPALCEAACTCGMNGDSVTVNNNELAVIEKGFANGWVTPRIPPVRSGKRVAIVGSGPSGLAAADQLNHRGHQVTVFERESCPGGLLMFGIPNMKLDKRVVERRIRLMEAEGVEFRVNANVGADIPAQALLEEFDAVVLCCGSKTPRDLKVPGREAQGVHFAVDYLTAATKKVIGETPEFAITAQGKHVVIVGGGDTGNDCLGTAVRQGAKSVRQFEFLPCAPEVAAPGNQWPQWPNVKKTDYGQQEAIELMGGEMREWGIDTLEVLLSEDGAVSGLDVVDLDWAGGKPERKMDTERTYPAQLVLIACGFTGPERSVYDALGAQMAASGRPLPVMEGCGSHRCAMVGEKKGTAAVYAAGDARNGSSLVVSAIADAMACAGEVAAELGL